MIDTLKGGLEKKYYGFSVGKLYNFVYLVPTQQQDFLKWGTVSQP